MLTQGKDEDVEESEEDELVRKRAKVIITKLAKPSTIVFNRRSSRKKAKKEGGDIIFKIPPPTFQDRLKELEVGGCIKIFKELKYETKTDE